MQANSAKVLELEIWEEDTQVQIIREELAYSFLKTKGMGYLVEILEHPYRSISAMELANLEILPDPQHRSIEAGAMEQFGSMGMSEKYLKADFRTVKEVKARLVQLTELEAELTQWCDLARVEEVRWEREALIEYLGDVLGVNQKLRSFPDTCSRQIEAVNKAICRALQTIGKSDEDISTALRLDLRIWRNLIYTPQYTVVRVVHR